MSEREYRFDGFVVDLEGWQLVHSGRELHLEPTVLKLLVFLLRRRQRLVTKRELLENVWEGTVVSESALTKAVARLRKALGDDANHPRYVETVHSLGYRFIGDIDPPEPASSPAGRVREARRGGRWSWTLVALLVVAGGFVSLDPFGWRSGATDSAGRPKIRSLAVLPLVNLAGDPEQDYFVEALHEVLITELSQIGDIKVISRQSTLRFRSSEQPMPEIARALDVDALIEGGVLRLGDDVRVTAQLIDGKTDAHLWAESYERDSRDVLPLLREVGRTISEQIAVSLEPERARRGTRSGPIDPAANEAYLRGLHALNQSSPSDLGDSVDLLQKAVQIAPDFGLGWGTLAGAHLLQAYYGRQPPRESIVRARVAALKALELDHQLFAGHAAIGWVRLLTWDWPGAGQAFENALRLNPNHPLTLHGHADYLTLTNQPEEGLNQLRRAMKLDPFSPSSTLPVPFHLYLMRRYDESLEEAERLQGINPDLPIDGVRAMNHWQSGRLEEGLQAFRKVLVDRGDGELQAALDRGYAESGPRGAMRALAEELVHRSRSRYVDPFRIAVIYARADEAGPTLEWLQRAFERGSLELIFLGIRPEFDLVRTDPSFQELVAQLGLPAPSGR